MDANFPPEGSTIFTPATTTTAGSVTSSANQDVAARPAPDCSVPWPGSTYNIRSLSTNKVITFHQGQVVLAPLQGHHSIRWQCVERAGWLGFQEPSSSKYLGYTDRGDLCCAAPQHNNWENFCVRQRPEGGYIMLMTHYENVFTMGWKALQPVGIKGDGSGKLAKTTHWQSETIAWEFIKVEPSQL